MRRLVIILLCMFLLTTAVFAENSVQKVENFSVLSTDGSCQVNMTVLVRLDVGETGLTFPLPKGAKNVLFNGAAVRPAPNPDDEKTVLVDLSYLNNAVGEYALTFQYTVPGAVKYVPSQEKDVKYKQVVELPLLSGFRFPVRQMQFAITMPGSLQVRPNFFSGYLQQSIESQIDVVVKDNMISGVLNSPLQDHETLTMQMDAPEGMFTTKMIFQREGNPEVLGMAVLAALAALYWLITMRAAPLIPQGRIEPLAGVTAGELGCRLALVGMDLTALVLNWAQLGYLHLELDRRGKVLLHKRMEMGNERDPLEQKLFSILFGKEQVVDGTGLHYARLVQKAEKTIAGAPLTLKKGFYNANIFRWLTAGVSLLSGVCLGMNLSTALPVQITLAVLLGGLGLIFGLRIQRIGSRIFLRGRLPILVGLVLSALWIGLGFAAKQPLIAAAAVFAQILAGFALAYGGRRTDLGRMEARLILGLRKYFKTANTQELHRIMGSNPNYFFEMAPYALALGVDQAFAKRFGKLPQPPCPYLSADVRIRLNTEEWALMLREVASILDAHRKKLALQRWLPWLGKPRRRSARSGRRSGSRRRPDARRRPAPRRPSSHRRRR